MSRVRPEDLLTELTRVERSRDRSEQDYPHTRRKHIRHPVRGDADLFPVGRNRLSSSPIEVQLRDLGRGGVGFVCHAPLPVGSSWRINFLCRGYVIGSQSLIVRHCTRIGDGLCLVGTQFVLDAGIMAALGADMSEFESTAGINPNEDFESQFLPPADVD